MVGYFMSLLITKILAGLPMVILRSGALSRMFLLRSCFSRAKLTQRELDEVYRKQTVCYVSHFTLPFAEMRHAYFVSLLSLPVASMYCISTGTAFSHCLDPIDLTGFLTLLSRFVGLLWLGISDTASCYHDCVCVRMHISGHFTSGSGLFLGCFSRLQEADIIRVRADL